ncbi:hypothetical protein PMO31116_01393 [Pandoraea morbifera]|uniref:Transmembrane protein n=1 Tax=Pandoraea morbifera TaxID=2508300 RepID=A0A5E4TFX4_9BURK|nr:hypothetical protein [Pandoraea morbifera]VVD86910.1 hypothetical protein PMO31116_01393 [Pandoraea morbifera]
MSSIDPASRLRRACLRAARGRACGGWTAWLIVALVCVQIWGLQHEIVHARGLTQVVAHGSRPAVKSTFGARLQSAVPGADAPSGVPDTRASIVADDDDNDDDEAAIPPEPSAYAGQMGFGGHQHHCHLFEGATLAAAFAVAVLVWKHAAVDATVPTCTTGRRHVSAPQLPFDSRAPPGAV